MIQRVLITCVGDMCRGPMAAALLNRALAGECVVSSAGIAAVVNAPAAEEAVELMRSRDLDISAHRARQLDLDLVRGHELILAAEAFQVTWINRQFPTSCGRVYRLGHWQSFDITDPFRRGPGAFAHALRHIERAVEDWSARLTAHEMVLPNEIRCSRN